MAVKLRLCHLVKLHIDRHMRRIRKICTAKLCLVKKCAFEIG